MGKNIGIVLLSILFGYLGTIIYPTLGSVCSISFIGVIIIHQLGEIKNVIQKGNKSNEAN